MKALEGIKVLDLTHALAGPFCTYQLQLLGAEVIKIEKPEVGDDFRDFARLPGWAVSPSFIATNGGKQSVTADLKNPEALAFVRKLAAEADVVVENQRPGSTEKLGLGYEQLSAINPKIIYCSISGYGQTGEMSKWLAYDHTIQAMVGMSWTGRDDDIPSQGRGFSIDCFSGYVAYSSILSALVRRERTGEGQRLDVAMLEAAMVLSGVGLVRQMITGDDKPAASPIVHDRPTVGAFKTKDGWLWLSGNFQNHYVALCKVIGAMELVEDPRFATAKDREANAPALRAALSERLINFNAAELEPVLMAAGCPAAKVRTSAEAVKIRSVIDRGMLQPTTAEDGREVTLMNAGFVANVDGPHLTGPIPALGENTNRVLHDLGYSEADVEHLREVKAI